MKGAQQNLEVEKSGLTPKRAAVTLFNMAEGQVQRRKGQEIRLSAKLDIDEGQVQRRKGRYLRRVDYTERSATTPKRSETTPSVRKKKE